MLCILETYNSPTISGNDLGVLVSRGLMTTASAIPGSGIILAPVTSRVGDGFGSYLPNQINVPESFKNAADIYNSAGKKNTNFSISDQIKSKKKHIQTAKNLGFNVAGQTIAAVDPSLIAIIPQKLIQNKMEKSDEA